MKIILLLLLTWNSSFAGHETGNALPDYDLNIARAWPKSIRPFNYCLKYNSRFGVNKDLVTETIDKAFKTWIEYIKKREVHTNLLGTNIHYLDSCDGNEHLTFYVGVKNDFVSNYKASKDMSIAHAYKTEMEPNKHHKGFIWIANQNEVDASENFPDWHKKDHLFTTILHELGHVYGNGHHSGTVMDEKMSAFLVKDKQRYLGKIDINRFLVIPTSREIFSGELGAKSSNVDWLLERYIFKMLMGREPIGKVHSKIEILYMRPNSLTVSDSIDSFKFELSYEAAGRECIGNGNRKFEVSERGHHYGGSCDYIIGFLTTKSKTGDLIKLQSIFGDGSHNALRLRYLYVSDRNPNGWYQNMFSIKL